MERLAWTVALASLLLLPPLRTDAAVWHVNASDGSDTAAGTEQAPFKSLAHAMSKAVGGDRIVLHGGEYAAITGPQRDPIRDIYEDWVTIEAAPETKPVIEAVRLGANASHFFKEDRRGTYNAYLRFKGIHFPDGVNVYGGENIELIDCLLERKAPLTGTAENIEKVAVLLKTTHALIQNCEVTNTAVGLSLTGSRMNVLGNHIHHLTHDGIRCISLHDSLIEGNRIHDADDGVDDGDPEGEGWNRHCDGIHIYIPGPGVPGAENRNLVFRNNVIYDFESQGVQFNNYFRKEDLHNTNMVFENNIFGPVRAVNAVNVADIVDGFVFRHNTFLEFPGGRTFGRITATNNGLRVNPQCTDVQIYNNILGSTEVRSREGWLVSNNLYRHVRGNQPFGRLDLIGVDPQFVDPAAFDGKLKATSPAIDAGTRRAPEPLCATDIHGVKRDARPDIGATEVPDRSPEPEPEPSAAAEQATTYVDDFTDGDYAHRDPWLTSEDRQGLSWKHLSAESHDQRFLVERIGQTNNRLSAPMAPGVSTVITQQGDDWVDYDLSFKVTNIYQITGAGPVLLVRDAQNYYWLELGRDAGRLLRCQAGTEGAAEITELARSEKVTLPFTGDRNYAISLRHEDGAIVISVDADQDGTMEIEYRDTDAEAIKAFTRGPIGFRRDYDTQYHRALYDDVTVTVKKRAE